MNSHGRLARKHAGREGIVYVLALLLICIFSSLAVAFISTTDLALFKGRNATLALDARLAAESGMNYLMYQMTSETLPAGSAGQTMLDNLAASLADRLDGTANLSGETVTYDGTTISVPQIALDGQCSFTAQITLLDDDLRLSVTGRSPTSAQSPEHTLARQIAMDLGPDSDSANPTQYGIFSKGPVDIDMNLSLVGANDPEEGSIYSAAEGDAIDIDSGYVDGDVCTLHEDAVIDCGATVNGDIETGVPEVPIPTLDGSVFEPFATNIVDASTVVNKGGTFENIRILAGTNPSFDKAVTIRGVMYVEAPNYVYFKNNVDFTGVIVTEDPGEGADPATHKIEFKNNLTLNGIEDLPDSSEFEDLKQHEGTAILAPGFALEFKNNFSSVSGTIAADSITLKNNLNGTVYGSIIIVGDGGVDFKNNSNLTIDQSKYNRATPGVISASGPVTLVVHPSSYTEGS